jgi:iron complex outermembrane receptor protein
MLFAEPLAEAQERFQETVVVTGAASPVTLGSANRTVVVLSRELVQALPVLSVADVLRLIGSVDVRARGERGIQSDFAVRGATFGQMLVLVDGVRLNDVQSGHHNGDIPVPIDAVDRIEVLLGAGASTYGADAFGGTVNVITRTEAPTGATVMTGANGLAGARGRVQAASGRIGHALWAGADRSSGFMYDRDYATQVVTSRTTVGDRTRVSASWLRKAFGANNFYGGNAPSREWTNQTLISARHQLRPAGAWSTTVVASYRTHGDRFVFNQTRPELSDNRHRSHTTIATLSATRSLTRGATITVGGEGGADWIRSTNLGDHALRRGSGFGEWRQAVGRTVQLDGALRFDRYERFGAAWNPSLGAGWWLASRVRVRGAVARAFRVPTFTERYYRDPANVARAEVGPERAWSSEAGVDVFLPRGWVARGGAFRRADADVIDWLRPTTSVPWQTYNVRDVDTTGLELSLMRPFGRNGLLQASFTGLDVNAPAVTQLSKYALDYAPRSVVGGLVLPRLGRVQVAPRVEYRDRRRPRLQPTGVVALSSEDYVLVDVRLGVRLSPQLELLADGTNLLDHAYQEIAGVDMPGAKLAVMLVVGRR